MRGRKRGNLKLHARIYRSVEPPEAKYHQQNTLTMPPASEKAKAKLDAVLNHPDRHNTSGMTNRIAATRYPSGGSDVTNVVNRRPSQSSQSSNGAGGGGFRTRMKDFFSLPAY
ncbi:hypothetical protein BKA56DRAFT_575584 [Ilyonectria sp. MPI-CAGE-AT-0026]|nr:hypothetical protein BKA56DRAFT_575584 [Ilyonectria sp. MPI-CAGE-AT-0026]